MPLSIVPFAGVRYHPSVVPDLAVIMTPPYDVISDAERQAYLAGHPANMIHLILGAERPTDTVDDNRFTRAAALLRQWRQTGVLDNEPQPAIYLYQQDFTLDGVSMTRTGFISRVRLEEYQARVIFPHETTFAGPKADLLRLWSGCQANLSQIFAVYHDPAHGLAPIFASILARPPQVEVAAWGEGRHRLWAITDAALIARVQAVMHDKVLVIADGHHRYETALALREEMRCRHPGPADTAPYEYVMIYCANIHDPGVVALPTHRLVRGLPRTQLEEGLRRGGAWLRVEVERRQGDAESLPQWQRRLEALLRGRQGQGSVFALYAGGDSCYIVTVPAAAARQQVTVATATEAWKCLDVSVLHYALLPALQAGTPPTVAYAKAGEDALQAVAQGPYDLAVLMNPTPLEALVTIAQQGERMPQKSTYFYPKLPTGVVINCFDS